MGSDAPKHEAYEQMQDTPWITQGRNIADKGGQGILDYYNKVNVFDDQTKRELAQRNKEIYNRAFDNMEREYTNTMNKYAAKNYGQFGTLNATAPSFVTDQYRIDAQRQMNDLAYDQAVNYDDLMDRELQRRYNTLNMFGNMYQYGNTPYQLDLANWNTRNTNKDIAYQNAMVDYQNDFGNRLANGFTTAFINTVAPEEGYQKNSINNISKLIGSITGGRM
jgi:hypothetical protein